MTRANGHTPRVRYQVAASLDGFIAGPHGEYDWIPEDPDIDLEGLFAEFDTLLMGRATYETVVAQGHAGPSGVFGATTCVVSTTLKAADHPGITIASGDLPGVVAALKQAARKDIWLFGGGRLFASLLALGLVDRVEIAVVPVLLGGGVPLLPAATAPVTLALARQRTYEKSGIVLLEYDVRR